MTTTTTTATEQLRERLKTTNGYVYDGIPVVEFGDAGEWLITIGHVDKTTFAKACDAYYRETNGDDWPRAEVARIADEATYRKARVVNPGAADDEWELRLDEGDVDVTVWAVC